MSVSDRAAFDVWYATQKDVVFDQDRELELYCRSDVAVLRQAALKFRQLFLDTASIDPFRECCTLASCCMLSFQANFLPAEKIALMPQGGYFAADMQSKVALEWLQWTSHTLQIPIQHAGNGREAKVGPYKLDGLYEPQKRAFEFYGCFYHGHPKCFPIRTSVLGNDNNDTMEGRWRATQARQEMLERAGYTVETIWECEWAELKKADPEVRAYTEAHPVLQEDPLDPRDAFFGGRTNNAKLWRKCEAGERICYADICSLYPYVNKMGKYPLGKPRRAVYPDCPHPSQFEGFIKCTVLPPQDLYHPILPIRMHNKLMFVLCYACAQACEFDAPEECAHSDEERMLKDTWVVDEVRYALEHGYTLIKTFEVWIYDGVTQYCPKNKDPTNVAKRGLFAEYVNKNLKLKLEASGWPPEMDTDEKRAAYVADQASKGVFLDVDNIVFNPSLRALSKLELNSLWGKFGQGSNLTKHVIVTAVEKH
ncbi:uncharacterized protein LOC127750891 [Frankliniella occidentalis]|uniref:DNA-directed DNA polymerase n=1 Tax=Frankliniella occidentalis TaxID=133901 RepID=A0A9C6X5K1_FRAOC|nr:uncharacterized protein LOC127750891 [Frankliniella occidentalis]